VNIIEAVYLQLIGYAPLVAGLGSSDQIQRAYPDVVNVTPLVCFMETNNSDGAWYDNQPKTSDEAVDIHIFTDYETPTDVVADLINDAMHAVLFTRDYQADQDDPSAKLRHKVMKFSRDNILSTVLS
jgi:hypothetical protein